MTVKSTLTLPKYIRAAIYVRVSTNEQAEHGYSLGTQIEACKNKAEELGAISVKEFIDDGQSGEFLDRPALMKLRGEIKNKNFDAIVIYDPDRLARNLSHQLIIAEEIEKSNAELVFVSVNFEHSPEGRLFFSIRGAISSFEKEKIKERTLRGKRGKASQGKVVSNANPLGYDYDAKNCMYVINEKEAQLVRKIFDYMVKDKIGTALICKELNTLGILSPRGKTWIVSSVHRILTNSIYKGVIYSMKYQYQKIGLKKKKRILRPESEWLPIKVPAIVSGEIWEAAQRQLKENKNIAKRNLKYDHLLNGLVVCAICGRKMTITHSATANLAYYACLSQRSASYCYSGKEKCAARRIPTKVLDNYVFNYLQEIYKKPSLVPKYLKDTAEKSDDLELKEKLSQLVFSEKNILNQRQTVMRWFRQQIISEAEAEEQLKKISAQILHIEELKRKYQNDIAETSSAMSFDEIISKLNFHFDCKEFTETEKKFAARSILEKIIVARIDNTSGRGSKPKLDLKIDFA